MIAPPMRAEVATAWLEHRANASDHDPTGQVGRGVEARGDGILEHQAHIALGIAERPFGGEGLHRSVW